MNDDAVGTILSAALRVNQEKRAFPRLTLKARVQILAEGQLLEGELVNLSLAGALIVPSAPLPLHTVLYLTTIDAACSRRLVNLRARVVRVDGNGVGVSFEL